MHSVACSASQHAGPDECSQMACLRYKSRSLALCSACCQINRTQHEHNAKMPGANHKQHTVGVLVKKAINTTPFSNLSTLQVTHIMVVHNGSSYVQEQHMCSNTHHNINTSTGQTQTSSCGHSGTSCCSSHGGGGGGGPQRQQPQCWRWWWTAETLAGQTPCGPCLQAA